MTKYRLRAVACSSAYNSTVDPTNMYTTTAPALISSAYNPPTLSDTTSNNLVEYPTTAQPSTYMYLDTLRRDYNDGMPSAVAFMQGLQDFTEECLHEQAEWQVDRRAEICNNHNITYPKRNYLATPQSWDAFKDPGHGLPDL